MSSKSISESSSGSPNQMTEFTDLTLFSALSRTGTVKRAKNKHDKEEETRSSSPDLHPIRKSLDSTYSVQIPVGKMLLQSSTSEGTLSFHQRDPNILTLMPIKPTLSLESIAEYKTKSSFSGSSFFLSRDGSSIDSSSSDHTDCATRAEEKTLSPGSSYLSWIESVNSEYFSTATSAGSDAVPDIDNKVGEWNNFWLNYNSARNRYISSPYMSTSNEDRTGDELSDVKSNSSTQREFAEKLAEQMLLSVEEAHEVLRCSQRITEILQGGLKRTETETELEDKSLYSQTYSLQNSVRRLTQLFQSKEPLVQRERSYSYAMDPQEIQRQKEKALNFKSAPQSSSSSCINALLSTGVAEILKKVMTKKRDTCSHEDLPKQSSDWSTSN